MRLRILNYEWATTDGEQLNIVQLVNVREVARKGSKRKLTYKLWDGDLLESYDTLKDAAASIPPYLAAHESLSDKLRLTVVMPTKQGAKVVLTVQGLDEILQYLHDSGLDLEVEDELE
jgi:hypothetical protein